MRALLICGFVFAVLGALLNLDIFAAMTQATIAALYYMLLLTLP